MSQKDRVLAALQAAPHGLTTGQVHDLGYIVNPRARVSQLRKEGHIIEVTKIKGTDSSIYKYLGFTPHVSMVQTDDEMFGGLATWHPLPNNFEVQYVR